MFDVVNKFLTFSVMNVSDRTTNMADKPMGFWTVQDQIILKSMAIVIKTTNL